MTRPVEVFVCSAGADEALRDELMTHLSPLVRRGTMSLVPELCVGEDVAEAQTRMLRAGLILLLVSADLLCDEEAWDLALAALAHRAASGTVIPVLVRACAYQDGELAGLTLLPFDALPVTSWRNRDEAWTEVVLGVRAVIGRIRTGGAPPAASQAFRGVPVREIGVVPGRLSAGATLGGYTLASQIGTGARCNVWEAHTSASPGAVAIKIPRRHASPSPEVDRDTHPRMRREARAVAAVDSPFVCRLIEILQGQDTLCLVLERLSGEPLSERLLRGALSLRAQSVPMGPQAAPNPGALRALGPLVSDVLEGLSAVHEAGVVHGNLEASNIFIETLTGPGAADPGAAAWKGVQFGQLRLNLRRERAKLLGFGFARIVRIRMADATVTALQDGRPEADERSDTAALGAIVRDALQGNLAHAPATRRALPPELQRFLAKAMAADPDSRFQTAAEMLEAWRALPGLRLMLRSHLPAAAPAC